MPAPKETSSLHPSIWLNGEESHLFFATNLEVYSMCRKFALSLSSHKKGGRRICLLLNKSKL
jgi:hypothetical protein